MTRAQISMDSVILLLKYENKHTYTDITDLAGISKIV